MPGHPLYKLVCYDIFSFWASTLTFSLFSGAASLNTLVERSPPSDYCGEVHAKLRVPQPFSQGKYTDCGDIQACLCISDIPHFMATTPAVITAVAIVGKSKVAAILTDLIQKCEGSGQCQYPSHSVPACLPGNPCGFTCKDGYTPYPWHKPTQCVCEKPHKECNGKCGNYHLCPSAYVKRDLNFGSDKLCPQGLTACGISGRGGRTWECLDTQHELESCGGCSIPLSLSGSEGQDCTTIPGVSDVSCVMGRCVVHRCMPGYDIDSTDSSCHYSEDKDPVILAAQYGLDHAFL